MEKNRQAVVSSSKSRASKLVSKAKGDSNARNLCKYKHTNKKKCVSFM